MIRWDEPIEAVHEDGSVVAMKVAQLNAGTYADNDHWLATANDQRFPGVPGSSWGNWARKDGQLNGQPGWRIRNVAQVPETPIDEGKSVNELSGCYKGVIHEMTATIWLMTQGYQVFKNVCPSGPIDLIAIRDTEIIRIDVKTATLKRQADGVMRYNAAFLTQEQESIGVKMLLAHNGVILGWRDDVIDPSRSRRALEKEAGR